MRTCPAPVWWIHILDAVEDAEGDSIQFLRGIPVLVTRDWDRMAVTMTRDWDRMAARGTGRTRAEVLAVAAYVAACAGVPLGDRRALRAALRRDRA